MSTTNETCKGCKYYISIAKDGHGECYRFPPTPTPGGYSARGKIKETDPACGEFDKLLTAVESIALVRAAVESGLIKKPAPAAEANPVRGKKKIVVMPSP